MASPIPIPAPEKPESKPKPNILILCTGNSCRSHIAEGILRSAAGDLVSVHSAGSKPAGYVHPVAIAVMRGIGIDISGHASKHMNVFLNAAAVPSSTDSAGLPLSELSLRDEGVVKSTGKEQLKEEVKEQAKDMAKEAGGGVGKITTVITVCGNADQACPFFPGQVNRYHWGFEDPAHAVGTEEEVLGEFRRVRDEMKLVFEAYGAGLREGVVMGKA